MHQRYIPLSFSELTYRWGIWDTQLNCWVISKTQHKFIFARKEAAQNKANQLQSKLLKARRK